MTDERRRRGRGGGWPWWRLAVPLGLMAAVATGWSGSVDPHVVDVSDKLMHFGFYGALAGAWVFALAPARVRPAFVAAAAFVLAVGYGVTDEALQSLTEHRDPSWADAAADVLGAGMVTLASLPLLRRRSGSAGLPSAGK